MTIESEELQALCKNLGLPVENQGNGALLTLLPFENAKEREAYGALLIESMSEGRCIRMASIPLFTLTDIPPQPELLAQFMASLLKQTAANRVGTVGLGSKEEIYYCHTTVLEDNTLTPSQFESLLAGMMEGIRSTYVLARQFSQEPADEGNEKRSPKQKLQQVLLQAEEALAVIERCPGTKEQHAAAWDFINDLLKPGTLPEEYQMQLKKLTAPVFLLNNADRPAW